MAARTAAPPVRRCSVTACRRCPAAAGTPSTTSRPRAGPATPASATTRSPAGCGANGSTNARSCSATSRSGRRWRCGSPPNRTPDLGGGDGRVLTVRVTVDLVLPGPGSLTRGDRLVARRPRARRAFHAGGWHRPDKPASNVQSGPGSHLDVTGTSRRRVTAAGGRVQSPFGGCATDRAQAAVETRDEVVGGVGVPDPHSASLIVHCDADLDAAADLAGGHGDDENGTRAVPARAPPEHRPGAEVREDRFGHAGDVCGALMTPWPRGSPAKAWVCWFPRGGALGLVGLCARGVGRRRRSPVRTVFRAWELESCPVAAMGAGQHTSGVRAYVGVTDHSWYEFLAARPWLNEVNFWRPGDQREFQALPRGEPFFFKTHHPHNRVVGGGLFNGFACCGSPRRGSMLRCRRTAPTSLASGCARPRRAGYRQQPIAPGEDPSSAASSLRDTCLLSLSTTTPLTSRPDFDAKPCTGQRAMTCAYPAWPDYFHELLPGCSVGPSSRSICPDHGIGTGPTYGDPRLTPQRLGQQAFQAVVLNAYDRQLRHHRRQDPPCPAGRPYPAAVSLGASTAWTTDCCCARTSTPSSIAVISAVDPAVPAAGQPAAPRGVRQRRAVLPRMPVRPIAVPHRRARPARYRDFLEWHLDEVFLASDAVPLWWLPAVLSAVLSIRLRRGPLGVGRRCGLGSRCR